MVSIVHRCGLTNYVTDYVDLHDESIELEGHQSQLNISINKVNNQNIHQTLIGIVHFSSSHSSTCKKKGFFLKKFTPFFSSFNNVWVRTNKFKYTHDTYARVRIDWNKSDMNKIECSVEEYIGSLSSFDLEPKVIKQLVSSHWSSKIDRFILNYDFTHDNITNRENLNVVTYSIDPIGCKDIDDALHYRYINGYHEIGVHIADVSSYFSLDSKIWIEMCSRVESIYMPDEIIHMYPEIFSTQIASLREGRISRAFSLIIILDNKYNIIKKSLHRTNINVKNLSYDDIEKMKGVDNDINNLYSIGEALSKKILKTNEYNSHKLVETFMVLANSTVAQILVDSKLNISPLIRVQKSYNMLKESNNGMINYLKVPRALYKHYSENISNKHNGLDLDLYTHFTSPIRRFADVIVHQLLTAVMYNDSNLVPNYGVDVIYKLNYYKHYYKKCVIYQNEINLVSELDDSYKDIKGVVLDLYDNKCRVLVSCNNKEFIFDITLYHHKLNKTINITHDTDKIIFTDFNKELKIGDNITVRVCYMPLKLRKLKAYIVEPIFMKKLLE
jgi:exoribonuclease R